MEEIQRASTEIDRYTRDGLGVFWMSFRAQRNAGKSRVLVWTYKVEKDATTTVRSPRRILQYIPERCVRRFTDVKHPDFCWIYRERLHKIVTTILRNQSMSLIARILPTLARKADTSVSVPRRRRTGKRNCKTLFRRGAAQNHRV
jgi:hypothetical protein